MRGTSERHGNRRGVRGCVRVPVLMIHGDRDAQVALEQSQAMDTALSRAGKPHRLVMIKDADHQMSSEAARITLLREIETFLEANVPTGDTAATAATH